MSTTTSDPREQFAPFIAALFQPDDIVEVRAIDCRDRPDGAVKLLPTQSWELAKDLHLNFPSLAASNAEGRAIYIGVNPRIKKGGGTAEHVGLARAFFVDFDGGVTPEQALARIADANLPTPSIVVSSGHGTHAYWLLVEPITDMTLWREHQKALIALLHTDSVIHDPPRIMRVPGFVNNKREPHVLATLVSVNDTKYLLDRFPAPVAVETAVPIASGQDSAESKGERRSGDAATGPKNLSRKTLSFLHSGEVEGNRNPALFRAACDYAGNEIPEEQAQRELGAVAERCGLKAEEVTQTIHSAYTKPRGPSRKPKAKKGKPPRTSETAPDDAELTDPEQEEVHEGDDDDGEVPQSERLARLAHSLYRFGRTELDEPFAVPKKGPNIALMFRGNRGTLINTLSHAFRKEYGRIPSAAARADAMAALEGETYTLQSETVHMRLAPHDRGVVVDLGRTDGQVVLIKNGVWQVLPISPVLFRRTPLTGEMPLPVRGGKIIDFRRLLNVTDRDWPLYVGWLVACFRPGIPHPILMLGGEQGTGKSTAAELSVLVVDPSSAPLRCPPRNVDDWVVAASGSWVVVLDNLSNIPEWLADALCRAVTGEGLVKRALFTDGQLAVLNFRRVVAITSIDVGSLRGDMGDRLVLIDLERIAETARLDDAEVKMVFAQMRPMLMGALLDLTAAVFNQLENVHLTARPRMADFARVLGAMDLVLGTKSVELFMEQRNRIAGSVVESNAVAEAVKKFIERELEWSGPAGQLLQEITPETHVPKDWPKTAAAMAGQLRRIAPSLRQIGLVIDLPRAGDKTRTYQLCVGPTPPSSPAAKKEGDSTAHNAQPPEESPLDVGNATSVRAVDPASSPNRPSNRPKEDPASVPENSDSGRSGGSGGQNPQVLRDEQRPGPPGGCHACKHAKWWSANGTKGVSWTCGSCHPPSPALDDILWWDGNEVLP